MFGKSLFLKACLEPSFSEWFKKTYHMISCQKKSLQAALKTVKQCLSSQSYHGAHGATRKQTIAAFITVKKNVSTNTNNNNWELVQFIAHAAHATGTMRRVKWSWRGDSEVTGCPLNQHPTAASSLSSAALVLVLSASPKLSLSCTLENKSK